MLSHSPFSLCNPPRVSPIFKGELRETEKEREREKERKILVGVVVIMNEMR